MNFVPLRIFQQFMALLVQKSLRSYATLAKIMSSSGTH